MMEGATPALYADRMGNITKTALVTGGNKGIGLAVVRQLAAQGYTTWLGSRDEARGQAAASALAEAGDVRFVALDVTDDASVAAAAAQIGAQTSSLDLLVNNAGIYLAAGDGQPSAVQFDTLRATYDVNVFGPLRVTRAFLPLLRATSNARIVMVGSGLGSLALQSDPSNGFSRWPAFAYSSSKTALNALTVGLANELRGEGIAVTVVNPGFVATDLNGNTGTLTTDEGARMVMRAVQVPLSGSGSFVNDDGTFPW
ncbi:SDR family NAD(P)-dependent oxidoreductase [Chondromyces apiculatus]|nr:SDR family NAD(P)-dependent oxidoreductase [Chondromyces apiculatus]